MEKKQKTFLNAILNETGERVMVMQDQKGSPFFVDINGNKYHIKKLDLSEALPPMMEEREQMKSPTNSCDDSNYCLDCINKKCCINCENGDMKETEYKVEPKFEVGDIIIKSQNSDINKFGKFKITDIKGGKYWYNAFVICKISEQDEWELVRTEPKFKVGDWVATSYGKVNQVVSVDKDGDGYTLDDGVYFSGSWCDMYHLWTIADAKDGDVLCYVTDEEDLWIMIFWSLYEPYEGHVHYHALLVNDDFSDKGTCCICINDLKPATKEQRDTLMKAMADAGYTFDFGKKELKKTEPKSKENKGNIGGFSSNSKWSEEDEKTLNEIFSVAARASLRKSTLFGKSYDYIKWQNWLKSLRPQNHWKPSSEQMKALNAINVTGGISYAGQGQVLIELYNDLKKLKEE